MLVRMRQQITGLRNGVAWAKPGELMDLPEDEAMRLVSHGYASVAPVAILAPESEIEEALITRNIETATAKRRKVRHG